MRTYTNITTIRFIFNLSTHAVAFSILKNPCTYILVSYLPPGGHILPYAVLGLNLDQEVRGPIVL